MTDMETMANEAEVIICGYAVSRCAFGFRVIIHGDSPVGPQVEFCVRRILEALPLVIAHSCGRYVRPLHDVGDRVARVFGGRRNGSR